VLHRLRKLGSPAGGGVWWNRAMSTTNSNNGNGTANRLLWWVIGSVCAPLLLALTGTVLNLGITSAQRISTLEAQMGELHRSLDQLGQKIDRLLEKRP
jgi:hypothetical protein